MKTVVLFYSNSGNTRALAGKKAAELGAEIEEVVAVKKPPLLVGLYRGIRRKKTAIHPLKTRLDDFDKIIIMSPVWAGHPVSATNSVFDLLPSGKQVELVFVCAGGGTKKSAPRTKALVTSRGCDLAGYSDIAAVRKNGDISSREIA